MMDDIANSVSADLFERAAAQFCLIVEGASRVERDELLVQIYQILPHLIAKAIALPQFQLSDDEPVDAAVTIHVPHKTTNEQWSDLYNLLKEKLGDWDLYSQVIDPTADKEAIFGSLADDIADIYRDLKEGLVRSETQQSRTQDVVWESQVLYYSHWGKHAIDALHVLHFRLNAMLS